MPQTTRSKRPKDRIGGSPVVTLAGSKANCYLTTPGFSGQVISVGSQSAYIRTDDDNILAACRLDQQPHPRSFLTDLRSLNLQEGMKVWVEDSQLRFSGELAIPLRDCQVWNRERLERSDTAPIQQFRSRCSELMQTTSEIHRGENLGLALSYLANNGDTTSLPTDTSPLVAAGIEQIRRLIPLCRSGDLGSVLRNAEQLIGLGPGLTPSGDDFIGGFLFMAYHLSSAYPSELEWNVGEAEMFLLRSESKTSRISFALLTDLAGGQSHESLHDLVDGLMSRTQDFDAAALVRRVTEIGHSSGWDMLTGMVAGTLPVMRRAWA
ncbi:MAG: DUF2877 domain-containing protein [Chloroflexi bacterium]|nr:DUF2877 domain-containing protein [Chloroflexota bacterium]